MSAVDDLIVFLRAQLDDDERVAREVAELAPFNEWDAVGSRVDDEIGHSNWEVVRIARPPSTPAARSISLHIARWDPARVLAEVEAKRRILDLHLPCCVSDWCTNKGCIICDQHNTGFKTYPCATLTLLAQPYAGRQGWREGWGV